MPAEILRIYKPRLHPRASRLLHGAPTTTKTPLPEVFSTATDAPKLSKSAASLAMIFSVSDHVRPLRLEQVCRAIADGHFIIAWIAHYGYGMTRPLIATARPKSLTLCGAVGSSLICCIQTEPLRQKI